MRVQTTWYNLNVSFALFLNSTGILRRTYYLLSYYSAQWLSINADCPPIFFIVTNTNLRHLKESAVNICINKPWVILGCIQCVWTVARQEQFSVLLFKPQINCMQFVTQMYFLGTAAITNELWRGQGRKENATNENASVQVLGNVSHTHICWKTAHVHIFCCAKDTKSSWNLSSSANLGVWSCNVHHSQGVPSTVPSTPSISFHPQLLTATFRGRSRVLPWELHPSTHNNTQESRMAQYLFSDRELVAGGGGLSSSGEQLLRHPWTKTIFLSGEGHFPTSMKLLGFCTFQNQQWRSNGVTDVATGLP